MARPAGAPDPRPVPTAASTAEPPRPAQLGLNELTWIDVADIVWLTAALRPRTAPPAVADPADEQSKPAPAPDRPGTERHVDSPDDPPRAPRPSPPVTPPSDTVLPDPVDAAMVAPRPELRVLAGDGKAPLVRAMSESLGFFRALRTLKRNVSSRRDNDTVLDEEATAEQAMETGMWWPVTTARKERWLDLTVVIDDSPSMRLWHSRTSAFLEMLEQLGAFRAIQVRLLDVEQDDTVVLRGATRGAATRDPDEVLDSSGRRAMLVVTDGVAARWRRGVLDATLCRWGRTMPVSVVNLLPRWLWGRGGMELHRAGLTVPGSLKPNNRWTLDLPDAWFAPDPAALTPPGTVPVPVIELAPRWLSWWARLITGEHRGRATGSVLLAADHPRPIRRQDRPATLSPHDLVRRFRSVASPPALRLATLLAALPARLDVTRAISRQFIPEAGEEHLGELLISGILYAPEPGEGNSTWDPGGDLRFPLAIREVLLGGARRSETAGVIRAAAAEFGSRVPVLGHLRDAIDDPNNTPDPVLTRETTADVELESAVMRALSGPYLSRADRLRNAVPHESPTLPVTTSRTDPSVSVNMPETAERADHPSEPAGAGEVRSAQPNRGDPSEPVTTPLVHPAVGMPRAFPRRQPDDPPPVWGNVPPRNPNFTGRTDLLDQLHKRLIAGGTTAVLPSALHGMGGIGKTQMATEYIYRHLRDYDIVWWIDAARTTQIRDGLTQLARALGLPGDADVAVPAVLEVLRTGRPFRRWLLVFDAADSPQAVLPFFPRNGPGKILITSRNSDWAGVARPLELAVFKREESIELLGRRGPEIAVEEADALAEKLGDLPLAIEQAAAWRAVTGMPVREYLRLFDESVTEILGSAPAPEYEVTVAAAWNVSFDELKTRNPAAHQILHVCAFFSPEPISRDLLTGVSRVSISPELDTALRDPIKLARAIRDINRYGLAKIDHGNNTLQLHRLVQLVLRNRVMAPQVHAQMQHGAHQLLASLDPNDPESSRNWPRYRELLPHAYAAEVMNCDDGWVRQLIINLMRFLSASRDHNEAARIGGIVRDHFSAQLGPTHPQTLEVSTLLGSYLWAVGRYTEASELNQRTLALRLEVSGEENEETFALQRNIVTDLRAQGDFAGATKLSEEIYRKATRMFGEDDPETLHAAYQYGISLRLAGAYRAAADLDEDTYRRRAEVLGVDDARTLSARSAAIVDRREAGEYGAARVQQEALTERYHRRYGEEHMDSVAMNFLLSVARRKAGDHNGALALSHEALARFRIVYGEDRSDTIACGLAHSIDLRHAGKLEKARELGERTFERYRDGYGESHPHTLAATVDLAVTLRLLRNVESARELDERAVEHFRVGIGPDHPYAIVGAINLASDLAALGNHEKAVELGRDALDRAGRVLGDDHPTALAARFNLGLDLEAVGQADEAKRYQAPVLDKYRRVLGEVHPGTQAAVRGTRADCDIDPILM